MVVVGALTERATAESAAANPTTFRLGLQDGGGGLGGFGRNPGRFSGGSGSGLGSLKLPPRRCSLGGGSTSALFLDVQDPVGQ